jgi:hypothetical protein
MVKHKSYLSNISSIPAASVQEIHRILPAREIQKLNFLADVKDGDRQRLISDIQHAAGAKLLVDRGKLALGKYIYNIHQACDPYSGTFNKTMAYLEIPLRSAYRFMYGFLCADKVWPENVVTAAIMRGLNIVSTNEQEPLGKYTEAARLLSPPTNPDMEAALKYVDQLEETRREINARRKQAQASGKSLPPPIDGLKRNPESLQEKAFREVKNALPFIPKRNRQAWFNDLVGMILTEMGHASSVRIYPVAIPEGYRRGPGRSRESRI